MEPTDPSALGLHKRQQGRVMELILQSLDAANEALIELSDTPKVAYDKLAKAHGSSGGVLAAATICDIATARFEPGQSLSDFITRIRNLHNQLAQYATEDKDIALSPKLLAIFLLNGLGKDFDYLTAPFYADIKALTVQNVLYRLVLENAKQSSSDSSSASAFMTRSTSAPAAPVIPSHRKIGTGPNDLCHLEIHKGFTHSNRNCNTQMAQKRRARFNAPVSAALVTTSSTDAELAKRYLAIEAAHLAKKSSSAVNIPAYAVSTDSFNPVAMADDFPDEGFSAQGYMDATDVTGLACGTILADTAATRSMVSDKSMFVHLRPISPISITGISDGQQFATHIGSIVIAGFSESTHEAMDILTPDVLFVPTMKVNLLSLSHVCENGASFSGSADSMTVSGCSGGGYFVCQKTADRSLWQTKVTFTIRL